VVVKGVGVAALPGNPLLGYYEAVMLAQEIKIYWISDRFTIVA